MDNLHGQKIGAVSNVSRSFHGGIFIVVLAIIAIAVLAQPREDLRWHKGDTDPIRIESPTPRYVPFASGGQCSTMIVTTSSTSSTAIPVLTPCVVGDGGSAVISSYSVAH